MQLSKYAHESQKLLLQSQAIAKKREHQAIEPEHLLVAMFADPLCRSLFVELQIKTESLLIEAEVDLTKMPRVFRAATYLSPRFLKVTGRAEALATLAMAPLVAPLHLVMAMAELKKIIVTSPSEIKNDESAFGKYCRNLTALAREGKLDPVMGRDAETRRLIQVLSRRSKNNPVLIGDPGVGKNSIIQGLAQRIAKGDVPSLLKNREILSLDLGSLLAGATLRGQFEERLKSLLMELKNSSGHALLFIDEIHSLVGAGGEGASDAANLLKPALARGEIQALGATTPEEYRNSIEKDAALERRFQPIWVAEPKENEALQILRGIKEKYESFHGVRIHDEALSAAVHFGIRYLSGRALPDKAIDLIDEAASRLHIAIDSVPDEIDEIERRLTHLKMELQSLDSKSAEHFRISQQIESDDKTRQQLRARWEDELSLVQSISALKEAIAKASKEQESAERAQEIERASTLKYETLEKLKVELDDKSFQLKKLQEQGCLIPEGVEPENIAEVVADMTGIPIKKMLESERDKLVHMEQRIASRVIGQKEAVLGVASAIRRSRAGLSDPNRPVGSFLFLGPTGVGKTELAKSLTDFLFDDEKSMIRFDMSEFMEKHAVARLIGAPPGYQGSDEGGQLTEAVRRRPYAVVLFDEVEKAHPDVMNILLQMLDDGRLTDSRGRLVDFKNTVIILTSNLGSDILLKASLSDGVIEESAKKLVKAELLKYFRPEFINRIDEVVLFHGLTRDNIEQISQIQLRKLDDMLDKENMKLQWTDDAKTLLIDLGFEPAFGARPLRRAIQKYVQDPLSLALLDGQFKSGDTILCVTGAQEKGTLEFTKSG